jgi:hypothetical protein
MPWNSRNRARRHLSRFRKRHALEHADTSELLDRIWGLNIDDDIWQPAVYRQHYRHLLSILDPSIISFSGRHHVIEALNALKSDQLEPLSQIKRHLGAARPQWMVARDRDEAASKGVEFLIQLWLMVPPRPDMHQDCSLTLKDIVAQTFQIPSIERSFVTNAPPGERLSPDFGAKNLVRIGGIEITWTSFLSEHLLLVDRHEVKVFAHVSLLRKYANSSERYVLCSKIYSFLAPYLIKHSSTNRALYPEGVLEETEETIELLFPTANRKGSKRTRRLRDRDKVDIEAARKLPPTTTISHYKHWGERLAIVQQAYDTAKPRHPKQWLFDRRNRVEWATLLVAVIVFAMTLVFGAISSVTGIMQVYASFRSSND